MVEIEKKTICCDIKVSESSTHSEEDMCKKRHDVGLLI